MKINRVTITGADNKIQPSELLRLTNKHPFVEWGILFSESKVGQQRYPSPDWMKSLCELTEGTDINLSAHFCGWYAKEVLEYQNYHLIKRLDPKFKRVQINYNFKNSKAWDLIALSDFAKGYDIKIILQYNNSNSEILNHYLHIFPDNIQFLYDGSGGRGTVIETIEEPVGKFYTGYAGGLNTENIESICDMINNNPNTESVWIDLESGARRNNEFDLAMVETILDKSAKFII